MNAETSAVIDQFEKVVRSHTTKKGPVYKTVKTDLDRVKTVNPSAFSKNDIQDFLEKRGKVVDKLMDDLFASKISAYFPMIDDNLFKMRRNLQLRKENKEHVVIGDRTDDKFKSFDKSVDKIVTIPLFAYTELFKKHVHHPLHTAELGTMRKTGRNNWGGRAIVTVKITAKLPGGISSALKAKYQEAMARCHKVLSDSYTDSTVGSMLISDPPTLEIGAIWIPKIEMLNVKTTIKSEPRPYDPAMILKIRNKSYLITTWEVDAEEPMENLIREFTTGSLEGKISPKRRRSTNFRHSRH